MDSLCEDLKREIISLLPINYLIRVNKNFASLYDNNYYKRYLNINYPQMPFRDNTDFLELCKKSFKEGDIYKWKENNIAGLSNLERAVSLNIRGIKASTIFGPDHLILRFNGDLWIYDGKYSVLIDTDVTDIDSCSYIKHNKWYYVEMDFVGGKFVPRCNMLIESDEDFININSYSRTQIIASTAHTLYVYFGHFPGEQKFQKSFGSKILNVLFSRDSNISLLLETKELIYINCNLKESRDRNYNIDYLFNGLIKTDNKYYIYDKGVIIQEFTDKYGKYINSRKYGDYILTDKYLLEIRQNNKIIPRISNLKNIYGGGHMVTYEIR